jgi:hypothetical protein
LYERKNTIEKKRVRGQAEGFSHDGSCLSLQKADDPEDGVFGNQETKKTMGGPVFDKINQTRSLHTY